MHGHRSALGTWRNELLSLQDAPYVALVVQHANDQQHVSGCEVVKTDILEAWHRPRAHAGQCRGLKVLGSTDGRHLADTRDCSLNGIEKPEADVRHALVQRVVTKLSEDIFAGGRGRDRSHRLFLVAGRAALGDEALRFGPKVGPEGLVHGFGLPRRETLEQ
jgi:hypothetical protein